VRLALRWLVFTALRLRIAVVALAALLMVAGIQITRTTPLDVFPEFAPPLVEIQTDAPGLSTAEVESLISTPVENALNGLMALKTITRQVESALAALRPG
jgi:Cu/Ag efflux pump CusA